MPIALSDDLVRFLRLRAQRLAFQQPDGVAGIVKALCGIQAQDAPAAALAVRARSVGLLAADVEHARVQERSIIRTWGMRGTLHLLATEDPGWLLPLLGPLLIAASRRRSAELGLDEDAYTRGVRAIRDALASQGPLTRAELVKYLDRRGIRTEGQAKAYLVYRAALEGFICLGPDRGAKPTYVLVDDWITRPRATSLPPEEACAELARRYLAAYGPAGPEDFAAWSGLPISQARAAWRRVTDRLLRATTLPYDVWMLDANLAWLDESPPDAPLVRLLPAFDTYLLGYWSRDLAVPSQYAKRINAGGGIIHPTVLVDGRVVGTWKSKRQKDRLVVSIEPFEPLASELLPGLEAEISDLARFLQASTTSHTISLPD